MPTLERERGPSKPKSKKPLLPVRSPKEEALPRVGVGGMLLVGGMIGGGVIVLLELRRTAGRTSRLRRMVYSELRTSSEAISRTRMAGSWAARSMTLSRRP